MDIDLNTHYLKIKALYFCQKVGSINKIVKPELFFVLMRGLIHLRILMHIKYVHGNNNLSFQ